jgi:indole-3-glycerol phosphate synthase
VTGARRFSQAISEGDGISLVALVGDRESARAAEEQGAEALVVSRPIEELGEATTLPVLWRPPDAPDSAERAGADACVVSVVGLDEENGDLERLHREALALGLDCVVEVSSEEELARALERIDPESLLLSSEGDGDGGPLDRALELLPDVPAGKLAVAELNAAGRDEVEELERAGVDAVIVDARNLTGLAGEPPPEV